MINLDESIFKAYDVRGIYPHSINKEVAYHFGRAFITFLRVKNVVVGFDARLSSPELKEYLIQGILDSGADVIDIGLCTSPLLNFTVAFHSDFESGIMVTASHNPPEYNGFKCCQNDASSIGLENGLEEIKKIMSKGNYPIVSKGKIRTINALEKYLSFLKKFIDFTKLDNLYLIVDISNGSAGEQTKKILETTNCQVEFINSSPDGSFPNHEPDPLKEENLSQIKKEVIDKKADLGIVLDGDADRVRFINEKGESVPADLVTALLAESFLNTHKKEAIVYDLRSSRVVEEEIKKHGGVPIICRVGHTFIKAKMKEKRAIFGGEVSGHYYFQDLFYTDNADMAYLKVIEAIKKRQKPFSEIMKQYQRYFQTDELNYEVVDQNKVLSTLESYYLTKYPQAKISKLDGLSIILPDFWFNIRPSNTEPVLRLKLEAKTKELKEEKAEELIKLIK